MPLYDFYTPRDFYGDASMQAKKFCKSHPEADKQTVYYASQDAATAYEMSKELRKKPFKLVVYICIKTALLVQKRKEEKLMNTGLKVAIIRDYESGMPVKEIAERYGLNVSSTQNNICNWAKKGFVELRTTKKAPATAATVTSVQENIYTKSIPQETEKVKTSESEETEKQTAEPIDFIKMLSIMLASVSNWRDVEILEAGRF